MCLGYNGRGVAMSTAMGPQLAQRIVGGKAADTDHRSQSHSVSRTLEHGGRRPGHLHIRDYLHV